VSYDEKHNDANGEDNRDGSSGNDSWNCGAEGETNDEMALALRARQVRNALVVLILSQGVPMLLAGDEVGRTQRGNNNAYCHDDELSWFDWTLVERNADLFAFTRNLLALRRSQPALRSPLHPTGLDRTGGGYADLSWHGVLAWQPDWSPESRLIAMLRSSVASPEGDPFLYAVFNAHWEPHDVEIPELPPGFSWYRGIDTASPAGSDTAPPGAESRLGEQARYEVGPRSCVVLVGRGDPERAAPDIGPDGSAEVYRYGTG
jgi:glycogen operon protein